MNLATSSREKPKVIWVRSLVPKEKNWASLAISSAVRAARGISIMVPTWYWTSTPSSSITRLATRSTSSRIARISFTWATRGIITLG